MPRKARSAIADHWSLDDSVLALRAVEAVLAIAAFLVDNIQGATHTAVLLEAVLNLAIQYPDYLFVLFLSWVTKRCHNGHLVCRHEARFSRELTADILFSSVVWLRSVILQHKFGHVLVTLSALRRSRLLLVVNLDLRFTVFDLHRVSW